MIFDMVGDALSEAAGWLSDRRRKSKAVMPYVSERERERMARAAYNAMQTDGGVDAPYEERHPTEKEAWEDVAMAVMREHYGVSK